MTNRSTVKKKCNDCQRRHARPTPCVRCTQRHCPHRPGEANCAAREWANTDPAGAVRAICTAETLRALRAAEAAADGRLRDCVGAVELAVEALARGAALASPDDAVRLEGASGGAAFDLTAGTPVLVVGGMPKLPTAGVVFAGRRLIDTLAHTAVNADGLSALALVHRLQPVAGALTVKPRSVLPKFAGLKDGALPVFGSAATLEPTPEQLPLFGAPGGHALLSCWWLDLWRASGIAARGASGYVPLPVRLRDQILGRIPATGWDGRPHLVTPPPTLRDLGPMLYPDGRTWPEGMARRWPTMRALLMQAARQVPVTFGDGSTYMWRVLDINLPVEWNPDLPVAIYWNIPGAGTTGGMRICMDRLRRLGKYSTAYRAYIVARWLCDRHARSGVDKTRLLADGRPNPYVERGAHGGQILARRGAEHVRVVPWEVILPVIFDAPGPNDKRRLLDALKKLEDGLGMPDGPDGNRLRDPFGIDFIERVSGVQILGDDWRRRPDSL